MTGTVGESAGGRRGPPAWRGFRSVLLRELTAYLATPVAGVFLIVFAALAPALAFYFGGFFARGQATLDSFFLFHPWLYLFLVPAIGMRLWAEERRSGTLELLVTLPVPIATLVVAKFVAAWIVLGAALALTWPMWAAVAWLGRPDNGVILAGYLGSWALAGALLSVAACISATTRSQVVAFVLAAAAGFLFLAGGLDPVLDLLRGWVPASLVDTLRSLSLLTHFRQVAAGIVELRAVIYVVTLVAGALAVNVLLLQLGRSR